MLHENFADGPRTPMQQNHLIASGARYYVRVAKLCNDGDVFCERLDRTKDGQAIDAMLPAYEAAWLLNIAVGDIIEVSIGKHGAYRATRLQPVDAGQRYSDRAMRA